MTKSSSTQRSSQFRTLAVNTFFLLLLFTTHSTLPVHQCDAASTYDSSSTDPPTPQITTPSPPPTNTSTNTFIDTSDQDQQTAFASFASSPTTPPPTLAFEIYDFCYSTFFITSAAAQQVNECADTLTAKYEIESVSTADFINLPLSAYTIDLQTYYKSYLSPPPPDQSEIEIEIDSPSSPTTPTPTQTQTQKQIVMHSSWDNKSHIFLYTLTKPLPAFLPEITAFCVQAFEKEDENECRLMIIKQIQDEFKSALLDRVEKSGNPRFEKLGRDRLNIFFNVYLAEDEDKFKNGVAIVEEQVNTILTSAFSNATVYYTTIGRPLPPPTFQANPNFRHLGHHDEGSEDKTLTPLHAFCLAHPTETVAYLHNKGSYTPTQQNDLWRRRLMNSIISATLCFDSLRPGVSEFEFDACGLRFVTYPFFEFLGNMWVAKCSYIQTLPSPLEFVEKHTAAVNETFKTKKNTLKDSDTFASLCRSCFGIERFALEHWVASSPHIKPADVLPDANFTYIYGREMFKDENGDAIPDPEFKLEIQHAPRLGKLVFIEGWYNTKTRNSFENKTLFLKLNQTFPSEKMLSPIGTVSLDFRLYQTFYSLKARVFFWGLIYLDFPKVTSWVWRHYGDREVNELLLVGVRKLGVQELKSGHKFMVDEKNQLHHVKN